MDKSSLIIKGGLLKFEERHTAEVQELLLKAYGEVLLCDYLRLLDVFRQVKLVIEAVYN